MREAVLKFKVLYHFDQTEHRYLIKSLLCLFECSAAYCVWFFYCAVIAVLGMELLVEPVLFG